MFKSIEKDSFYYGAPVILMTTRDQSGRDNITPISSSWTLGKDIVLGLGLEQQGYLNLLTYSDLTLNLADKSLFRNVEKISKTTGNPDMPNWKKSLNYQVCSDKFSLGNFTKLPGDTVSSVRIAECPIQLEAKVKHITERDGYAIVECQIQTILVDEKILHDERHIDVSQWTPLIYKFRSYTSTGETLGINDRFAEFSGL